jgi:hypothetical protein
MIQRTANQAGSRTVLSDQRQSGQGRFLTCLAVKVARQPGFELSGRATANGPFGDASRATDPGSIEAVVMTALPDKP